MVDSVKLAFLLPFFFFIHLPLSTVSYSLARHHEEEAKRLRVGLAKHYSLSRGTEQSVGNTSF